MNLAHNLTYTARTHPARPAVRLDDHALTYEELEELCARVAGWLRHNGHVPGDRIGLMLPNVPEFAALAYGVLRAGCIVVPMNPLFKEREVAYYLRDSGSKTLFAWHQVAQPAGDGARQAGAELVLVDENFAELMSSAAAAREVVERDDHDTAVILYTSGTTGEPKGAELTHANLVRNVEVTQALFSITADDVVFGGLPMFHVFGFTCALNTAIRVGAAVTLVPRFEPARVLKVLHRDHVTIFEGVPTMYAALLHDPGRRTHDVSALRLCVSGGAALPVEVLRGFEREFGCMILEGYGLSETSPVVSFNHPDRVRKPGSIGTPVSGVEMRLVDEQGTEARPGEIGEIVVRGHNIMKSYWRRADATAAAIRDGWFHTGDLARVDADGYFFIVDRKKDLIIRGGYNVYPRELEEVFHEHPAVAEVAVFGVPHPELGEEVAAAVVLKPGATARADELRDYLKAQVAAYKYPRLVQLVETLPKGPTGKLLKRELRISASVSKPAARSW
ncbi:long-chain fatty acid--CoA ligase [Kribbella solani]|uniref:Long-chain acyl-CoA synthetase n=1 Tax=Kribbella solani TaxID=236067 RepID=A0A841DKY8_9ACTN|nr:long-chain acyl-CoA synthetase [Kribbella solani]